MNDLQVFRDTEFGDIKILMEDGGPLFAATESAKNLGYSNPYKAIADHCRYLTKREVPHPQNPETTIEMNFIPEGDLYRLIARSNLPSAQRFERKVFDEILPTIRRTGSYSTAEQLFAQMTTPDAMIQIAQNWKIDRDARLALEAKVEQDKPKVEFAEAVADTENTILVGDLARMMAQNGIVIGQNRLFKWLRSNGYIIKDGESHNIPTQRSIEQGLMTIKEVVVEYADGTRHTQRTPKITGKGQVYFMNKVKSA